MYEVVKRDGQVVDFNIGKIADAIKKAFEATKTDYNGDILDFLALLNVECLSDHDWQCIAPPAADSWPAPPLPSVAQQLLARAFIEIETDPTVDNALKVMPLLQEAMRHNPKDPSNRHCMSVVYHIMGDEKKAEEYND